MMLSRWAGAALIAAVAGCSEPSSGEPDWMADLDDTRMVAELTIPGTHDSGARFDLAQGLAKCQDLTIADQLAAGVRFFDLRCRHVQDQFLIYHGVSMRIRRSTRCSRRCTRSSTLTLTR